MLSSLKYWHLKLALVFKSLLFPETQGQRSTFHEVDSHVSISCSHCPLSRCLVEKLCSSYHPCNGLQTALITTWWTMQSGTSCRCAYTAHVSVTSTTSLSDSCRSGPDLTMRSSVLQLLTGKLVCVPEWSQTEDILNTFTTIDEWSHCFIGDNWTCSPCCHGKLSLWFVTENM